MSRINVADTVVGELCERMGLGERTLNDKGRLALRFNDAAVVLSYRTEPVELLWIHVELGEVPQEGSAALNFLMRIGFDSWGQNRMTIGLDKAGRNAWGYTCIPLIELSYNRLEQVLSGLLEVAMPVRERIAQRDFKLPPPATAGGRDGGLGDGMVRV